MGSFIYVLGKPKGIYFSTEFTNHGSMWTADVNIKVTQYQKTLMQWYKMVERISYKAFVWFRRPKDQYRNQWGCWRFSYSTLQVEGRIAPYRDFDDFPVSSNLAGPDNSSSVA